jgi:hypothetical protein
VAIPPGLSQIEARRLRLAGQMNRKSRIGRSRGCCLGNIVSLIGLLILAVIFSAVFDYLVAPWSWGVFGKPTLTGEWVGTYKLPQGQVGAAYLNLTHDHNPTYDVRDSYSIHNLPPFGGTGQGCIGTSGIQAYSLSGGATSNGQNVEVSFKAQKPTVPGYALQSLKGAWDGSSLTLAGTFTTILDTQDSTRVGSEPNQTQPTTIVFHNGSRGDFAKACQTLRQ